jgi:glycosyltransferase involved in cell wall biosynthesis
MDIKHVEVIMSSYNGEKYIQKQLDSIFSQKWVNVTCFVRDDGSSDKTLEILQMYHIKNPKLRFISGVNLGWEKSFLEALRLANYADFYAFSDQDDVWFENKLATSVNKLLKEENQELPILFHCSKISTDETLKPIKSQAWKISTPINKKNALVQEYVQGCSAVINNAAKDLICSYLPKTKIPHDYWVGTICYFFGKIIYDPEPLFYHVNHGNNASSDGHIWESRFNRLKKIIRNHGYINLANDVLQGYSKFLSDNEIDFLKYASNYKSRLSYRFILLCDPHFRRISKCGTLALKLCILTGHF